MSLAFLSLLFNYAIAAGAPPIPILVPGEIESHIEASAIVYVEQQDRFLVASDDTVENWPELFWMSRDGQIDKTPAEILGVGSLTDVESLSLAGGDLYILSSQSRNRHGINSGKRNWFIRASIHGDKIKVEDKVELRPLILKALDQSEDPELRMLGLRMDREMNIESHFVVDGEVYVGLKGPQLQRGRALILKLGKLDEIFYSERESLSHIGIFRQIDFQNISHGEDLLSDIFPTKPSLVLTTTSRSGIGRIWCYDLASRQLSLLQQFPGLHPEGVAFDPILKKYIIVFDEDQEDSRFSQLDLRCG